MSKSCYAHPHHGRHGADSFQELLQLNQELASNAKQLSDHEALIHATQALRQDRDRLAESQRDLRRRVEELEAVNKQLTNMLRTSLATSRVRSESDLLVSRGNAPGRFGGDHGG